MITEKKFKPKITFCHVFAIALIITALFSYQMDQYKNSNILDGFVSSEEIKNGGSYERILTFEEDVDKICKKGDTKLQEYYQTADLSLIKLDAKEKEKEKENEKDLTGASKALKDIIAGEGEMMDSVKTYLISLIPVLIFIVFAILSIPGWIICCCCCCCNCCCCCCCKKGCCRFPFLIVTLAFNAVIIVSCIYGLTQSNKIFVGLANTECAILKFIGEIQDGETNPNPPRWIGFNGINDLFDDINKTVSELDDNTNVTLQRKKNNIVPSKNDFENYLKIDTCNIVESKRNNPPFSPSIWLEVYERFGKCSNQASSFTFYAMLNAEYSTIATESDKYLTQAIDNFGPLLGEGSKQVSSALNTAKEPINDIESTINDLKSSIAEIIIEYSETIETYGKIGFKAVFSVLTAVDAVIVALLIIYFIFGTTLCLNCKCLRCLNKCFIHLIWNILALLMIITFLIGAIFALVGRLGNDLFSVVSFLLGEENLGKNKDALLLGDVAEYLGICFNGNGSLSNVLELDTSAGTKNIQPLNDASKQINELKKQFQPLKNSQVIKNYTDFLKGAINYEEDNIEFRKQDDWNYDTSQYNLYKLIQGLNSGNNYWSLECPTACSVSSSSCGNPKNGGVENCLIAQGKNPTVGARIDIIVKEINELSTQPSGKTPLKNSLDTLSSKYGAFIETEIQVLDFFNETIKNLTGILDKYIGEDGDIFSFLNCTFINTDKDIILKYLREALGSNIYKVGIFLLLAACGMAFSIIF